MDRRFDTRLRDMLAQAEVSPELIDGLLSRLETFVHPFTASLREPEQHRHTVEYMTGLLSKLEHKTGEGIAYLHDQERQGIQKFIGQVPWDHAPLLTTLARFDVALFSPVSRELILAKTARLITTARSLESLQPRKEPRHDHGRRFSPGPQEVDLYPRTEG
jgi:DDE superfamily endonuclease